MNERAIEEARTLRATVLELIARRPGITRRELHDAFAPTMRRTPSQLVTALSTLRDSESIHCEGRSHCPRYYVCSDGQVRASIPAAGTALPACSAMPERALGHAEYWLHLLSRATA